MPKKTVKMPKRKRGKPSAATKKLVDKVVAQLHHQPTEEEALRMVAEDTRLAERLRPFIEERGAEQLRAREHPDHDSKRRGFVDVDSPEYRRRYDKLTSAADRLLRAAQEVTAPRRTREG